MKKTIGILVIAMIVGLTYTTSTYAQTAFHQVTLNLGESALLGITTGNINLNLSGASEAGAAISTSAADSTTRLRISSSVSTGKKRKIDVGITTGNIDGGSSILVKAFNPVDFGGDPNGHGSPLAEVELNGSTLTSGTLINNIGLCWSGVEDQSGYQIKYTLKKPDGATFTNGRQITITYTLSGEL